MTDRNDTPRDHGIPSGDLGAVDGTPGDRPDAGARREEERAYAFSHAGLINTARNLDHAGGPAENRRHQ
jgi:hypothetical protein